MSKPDHDEGWVEIDCVVAVPGWETRWFEIETYPDSFGVIATSAKLYPNEPRVIEERIAKLLIEKPNFSTSVGEYLEQSWTRKAEELEG